MTQVHGGTFSRIYFAELVFPNLTPQAGNSQEFFQGVIFVGEFSYSRVEISWLSLFVDPEELGFYFK